MLKTMLWCWQLTMLLLVWILLHCLMLFKLYFLIPGLYLFRTLEDQIVLMQLLHCKELLLQLALFQISHQLRKDVSMSSREPNSSDAITYNVWKHLKLVLVLILLLVASKKHLLCSLLMVQLSLTYSLLWGSLLVLEQHLLITTTSNSDSKNHFQSSPVRRERSQRSKAKSRSSYNQLLFKSNRTISTLLVSVSTLTLKLSL
jgi:hypothetical protein